MQSSSQSSRSSLYENILIFIGIILCASLTSITLIPSTLIKVGVIKQTTTKVVNPTSDDNNNNVIDIEITETTKTKTDKNEIDILLEEHSIIPRPFLKWSSTRKMPCYPADEAMLNEQVGYGHPLPRDISITNDKDGSSSSSLIVGGMVFVKPMKVGGTTAASIHARIALNEAKRQNIISPYYSIDDNKSKTQLLKHNFCRSRWSHANANEIFKHVYDDDDNNDGRSNINNNINDYIMKWSMLRNPTKRATSQFFHFVVSRRNVEPTDENFMKYTEQRSFFDNYYLQTLRTNKQKIKLKDETAPDIINTILDEYDFIGVTERFDESAVVLMMLFHLDIEDIMYLSSKSSGGYDDGKYRNKCHYIQRSYISDGMNEYFHDENNWLRRTKWDRLLHIAVNRSLDMTIDHVLGRNEFNIQLERFQKLQTIAHERCLPHDGTEIFPCTSKGQKNKNHTCLWNDSGCGNDCLDQITI